MDNPEILIWALVGLCAVAIVIYVFMNMNSKCPESPEDPQEEEVETPTPGALLANVSNITVMGPNWIILFDGPIQVDLKGTLTLTFLKTDGTRMKTMDIQDGEYEIRDSAIVIEAVSEINHEEVQQILIG